VVNADDSASTTITLGDGDGDVVEDARSATITLGNGNNDVVYSGGANTIRASDSIDRGFRLLQPCAASKTHCRKAYRYKEIRQCTVVAQSGRYHHVDASGCSGDRRCCGRLCYRMSYGLIVLRWPEQADRCTFIAIRLRIRTDGEVDPINKKSLTVRSGQKYKKSRQ
jgi:hypothetical protein